MANGGDMSEKQITVKSCLKAGRVRDILRELERQGIAVPF
jgi:transcription initiation factor IIE alpha subunit